MANVEMHITVDDLSPMLRKLAAMGKDPTPVMRAMGTTFKSITEGTFNSAGADFRPEVWPAKIDGTPSNLQLTTTMSKAFSLVVDKDKATVSNPMPYAAIHQFGSGKVDSDRRKKAKETGGSAREMNMPARPFFPVRNGQLTPRAAELVERAGMRQAEREIAKG